MHSKGTGTADTVPSIWTPQLELVAMRPECLQSELGRDRRLGELLGCDVTAEWPPQVWEPHVWELLLERFMKQPKEAAWHRYVLLRGPNRVLVGTVNAGCWSDDPDEAELGYALVPEFWGRGLATEAAMALVSFVEASGGLRRWCAHTYPEVTASVRILERCGFVLEGPGAEERTVRYAKVLTHDPIYPPSR